MLNTALIIGVVCIWIYTAKRIAVIAKSSTQEEKKPSDINTEDEDYTMLDAGGGIGYPYSSDPMVNSFWHSDDQ